MARFRISLPAQGDVAQILAISAERWSRDGRRRYAAHLAAAMQRVGAQPDGPNTRRRDDLFSGLRSFHVRYVRNPGPSAKVRERVHVLYYLQIENGLVEIVRILHERMEPSRYLGSWEGGG